MTVENMFFKYQKIDEYCIKNLSENQLYFRDPTKFNDPFDCLVFLDGKAPKEVWIDRIMSRNKCDLDTAIEFLDRCIGLKYFETEKDLIYPTEEYYKDVSSYVRDLHGDLKRNSIPGVCCFCKDNKNILMWSHYANDHRGICLCFQFSNGWISQNIHKVKYVNEIEPISVFDVDIESKVRDVLYKKFDIWTYEQEYRILLNVNSFEKRVVNFEKTDLKKVIFGLRINREDATSVYNNIKINYLNKGIHVEFCKVESVRGKYEIKNVEIDDINEYLNGLKPALRLPSDENMC
jgi:hypothetical protein